MKCSAEHLALERRLKRRWHEELKRRPDRRKKRRGTVGAVRWAINSGKFWRYVVWMMAFLPFPQGWVAAVTLALMVTLIRTSQLANMGGAESVIALYGAKDESILLVSRQWMRQVAVESGVDAMVFVGIWGLTGRIPWVTAILAVPCYMAAVVVGTRLFADLIPPKILNFAILGTMLAPIAISLTAPDRMSTEAATNVMWFLGALCPAGWTVLMLHELIAGQWLLLTVIPLVAAGFFVIRSAKRRQEDQILADCLAAEPDLPIDFPPSRDRISRVASGEFSQHLALLKPSRGLEFPRLMPAKNTFKLLCWGTGLTLLAALNARFAIVTTSEFRYVIFAGTLLVINVLCLPILGTPTWLGSILLSVNRSASLFTLFPISLRTLLLKQIRQDLKDTGKVFLPLLFLAALGFLVAGAASVPTALLCGLLVMVFVTTKLPVRWFHLATLPLSSKPLFPANIWRVVLTILVVVSFLAETLFVILFIVMAQSPEMDWSAVLAFLSFGLALCLFNIVLNLLCAYLSLLACEKNWVDLVAARTPNPNSL